MYDSTDFYSKTIYRRDYKTHEGARRNLATFESEYPNLLSGPYYQYLVPEGYRNRLPPDVPYEDPNEVIERVVARRPQLKRYFIDDPLNLDIITNKYKYDNRTVYQVELCKIDDFVGSQTSRVHLPDDYKLLPTTQRSSYRNPYSLGIAIDLQIKQMEPPKDNLKICEVTRRVMQTVTGESEYMGVIGRTGSRIINEHLFGAYTRAKRPNNWEIQCSMVEFLPKKQDEGLCWKATQTSKRKKPY